MRAALLSVLLIAPPVSMACAASEDVPPEISRQGPHAMLLYKMQRRFESADAVFEGRVESVEFSSAKDAQTVRAKVQPGRIWKTDGGDLDVVITSRTSCGANLNVGSRYVFMGGRNSSYWSFLPWIEEPIGVSVFDVVWIGPYQNISAEDLAFHRQVSLDPLAKVLNAPELRDTPSN